MSDFKAIIATDKNNVDIRSTEITIRSPSAGFSSRNITASVIQLVSTVVSTTTVLIVIEADL